MDIYERALRAFINSIGNKIISLIGARDIDIFKQTQLQTILPTTLNIYLRSLKAAFNKAVQWEILERNPFTRVSLCPIPEQTPNLLISININP